MLPERPHRGACVYDSKEAFHKSRCSFVEEYSLKHEDIDHLNPSLWKPSMLSSQAGWRDWTAVFVFGEVV